MHEHTPIILQSFTLSKRKDGGVDELVSPQRRVLMLEKLATQDDRKLHGSGGRNPAPVPSIPYCVSGQ